ncbi:hypothetical protein PPTG_22967 [Phytophthora nicotianae INRA-310]|uniref:Uncharacterized protein n=1 Tax=Phytophthora nicotianae (strain INRA-310) TaxID=761204 RepID=W2Q912_PHYN3|nr:hypothetical protein PPTG_22967 [Phytophthora nicotianae INRA-310]ETN08755.1 hypothetical protein PPTG_22967 [Phytophthora nicotianae INRA-310]
MRIIASGVRWPQGAMYRSSAAPQGYCQAPGTPQFLLVSRGDPPPRLHHTLDI